MIRFITSLALALAGLVLFGQGAYIHARRCWRRFCWSAPSARPSPPAARVKPWSWADTWPGRAIEVKRLHVSAIVLAEAAARRLPSGRATSSSPRMLARRGVAVYSAHRDTHFRFWKDIAIRRLKSISRKKKQKDEGKERGAPERSSFAELIGGRSSWIRTRSGRTTAPGADRRHRRAGSR